MKKKALSLALALVMCLGLAVPAFAANTKPEFEMEGSKLKKYNGSGGDVVIPNGITSIGDWAFSYCTGLTSVTIPYGVTSIGEDVFRACSNLTSVTIPDSVTRIGCNAFYYCTSLTSVTIPDSVTNIGSKAFRECRSLIDIQVDASNQTFTSVDGVLFSKDRKILVCYPAGKQGAYVIPDGVTRISSFYGCTGLTSVTIPDSVTKIGLDTFYNCKGLTSVTIPDSVTKIEQSAFTGCRDMTDVYYGGSEAQWTAIKIDIYNNPLTEATIHYNSTGITPAQPAGTQAQPTNDSLLMDGDPVEAAAYKIDGSNYFKLRDVAALLTGTSGQFNVGYDPATQSAVITTGQPYQLNGTELKGKPTAGGAATVSGDSVIVNGQKAELTVYKINGENYFKLRDLGRALDFNVGWSKDKGMYIDSGSSYTDAD